MIIKTTLGKGHSVSEDEISKFQIRTKQEHFKADTLSQNKNIQSQIGFPGSYKKRYCYRIIMILPQRDLSYMLQQS